MSIAYVGIPFASMGTEKLGQPQGSTRSLRTLPLILGQIFEPVHSKIRSASVASKAEVQPINAKLHSCVSNPKVFNPKRHGCHHILQEITACCNASMLKWLYLDPGRSKQHIGKVESRRPNHPICPIYSEVLKGQSFSAIFSCKNQTFSILIACAVAPFIS